MGGAARIPVKGALGECPGVEAGVRPESRPGRPRRTRAASAGAPEGSRGAGEVAAAGGGGNGARGSSHEEAADQSTREEYAAFVKPHENALFAGALRFTNNRADAEDLFQEALMRGYVGFKRSGSIDRPRAWLFKIMTNAFINRYHKKRRRPAMVSYDDSIDHRIEHVYAAPAADPQEKFFAQFLDGEIRDALESLPEHFRQSIILCDISGLSYSEIRDVLNCPLGTVRSRISRGRELLFHKLYDYAREKGLLPKKGENPRRRRPAREDAE